MTKRNCFFNINNLTQGISRELAKGINTRIFPGDMAMLSVVKLDPNAVGSIHRHDQEQWGYLIEGSAIRIQDGRENHVKQGDFWLTPGGVEHGIIAGPKGATVLDVFSPPRSEYTQAGSGFGT